MKEICLTAILVTGCLTTAFAQTDAATDQKKEKTLEHYVGVQLNPLIRQVLNFNGSTTSPVVSGYLLTYNITHSKTGWGLRLGGGYNYASNWSNDGITETTTTNEHEQVRIGVEKRFKLSDKWTSGVGVDGIANLTNNHNVATVRSTDTVTTDTRNSNNLYGGEIMSWLRYSITKHILIGTEAALNYTSGKQTNTTVVTQRTPNFGGVGSTITSTETTSKPTVTNSNVILPVAFYLVVRF